MSLLKRTVYGFAWNHAGRVGEYLLLYVVSVLIARRLGPDINGIYATFLSVSHLLLVCTSLGLETSVVANVPRILERSGSSAGGVLRGLLLVRLGVVLAVALPVVLLRTFWLPILHIPPLVVEYLLVLLLYFGFRSIVTLLVAFLTARLAMRGVAGVSVGVRILELTGVVVLLESGQGLGGILILLAAAQAAQGLAFGFLLKRELFASFPAGTLQPILVMGSKFWLNTMMEFFLGRQADVLLLGFFLVGTASIGQYDVAMAFAHLINFGTTTGLAGVSVTSMSSLVHRTREEAGRYVEAMWRFVILAVLPVFIFAVYHAGALIPALYSPAYSASVPLFEIFALFLIGTRMLGGGVTADYLQASGNTGALLRTSAMGGGSNILLALVLIPRFGAAGAVYATGIAALFVAGLHWYYAGQDLRLRLPLAFFAKVLGAAALAVLLSDSIIPADFSGGVILQPVVYAGVLLFFAYLVKPLHYDDVAALTRVNPVLGDLASRFTRPVHSGLPVRLTDRQKWAYAWMPQCDTAVDVGSSDSPLTKVLARKAARTIAVDTDTEALSRLARQSPPMELLAGSGTQLPLRDASVDVLFLLDVLEHTGNEQATIDESWRVLKQGGVLILSVPHAGLFRFLDPQNLAARVKTHASPGEPHPHYTEANLLRILGDRFEIVRRHYGGLFLYPLTFAADNFVRKHLRQDWSRLFKRLGDLDNDVSWGRFSYNLIIMAEKT